MLVVQPQETTRVRLLKIAIKVAMLGIMAVALSLTYDKCIGCVLCIAIFSAMTMNCIPLMPIVFVLSVVVLLYHSIDYNKATIKVEVPLQDVMYIPTWKDVQEYVHVTPNTHI